MAFDPYESWLGIPAADRPPTYYRLLGLSPFESNLETIEHAALRRMGKVRQYQIGPHSDESQEILAELARARLVLIDPDRRADYDAKLRARDESRFDRSVVVATEVIVDAASAVPAPALDGLDFLGKIRAGDDRRPDASVAADINLVGVATRSAGADLEGGLNNLASIATQDNDGVRSVRPFKKKNRTFWKNRLFVVSFLGTHVAIIGGFFAFGSTIALHVRSFLRSTDSAAQAIAQNPIAADGHSASPRPAPTTWLKFTRGTRINVARSDDFDMSEHDFTIFAQIKTGTSGTLFSKGPAAGDWAPGAKRLFLQNGRLSFQFCQGPTVETPGRQVNDELWHDIAVTYTAQDHQLYLFIDGTPFGPRTVKSVKDVTGHVVRIGSPATDVGAHENEHFAGLIAEVRFYQRALTVAEIDGLPTREPAGKLPLARWKLREGVGKFFRDQTMHNHIGTLEDGDVSNDAVLAANEKNPAKLSASSGPEGTLPAIGNPPPAEEARGGAEIGGSKVQKEAKVDRSPEGILEKNGLKGKGQLYVHEAEDDFQRKVNETLLLAGALEYHLTKKRTALNAELRPAWIHQLEIGIAERKDQITFADRQMNDIQSQKFRGRFFNNEHEAVFNDLTVYKARLQVELNQANGFLNELKSQPANLQWNQRDEESLKADQQAYDRALGETRDLVNKTNRKYDDLKKNDEVRKALEACGKKAKQPFKLGPSDKFAKNVGELEKLERAGKRGGKRRG